MNLWNIFSCFSIFKLYAAIIDWNINQQFIKGVFLHFDTAGNINPSNIGPISDIDLVESDGELDRHDNEATDEIVRQLLKSKKITRESDVEEFWHIALSKYSEIWRKNKLKCCLLIENVILFI